ncbi:hypothetical protein QWZ13_08785 [Reinekea marina]|uniref:Uncharacterized protein n=1 Tax=Reinekea marina TaxID=1310421 RepID=A0ABV7WVZ5_9GAMM|nr:hypothetical protein [Reinekea marina]MDN3649005.1 hypothetical protein [Reinekea marina]
MSLTYCPLSAFFDPANDYAASAMLSCKQWALINTPVSPTMLLDTPFIPFIENAYV